MISVLISIRPRWCKLIASGQKTVEVRKTRPQLETPFKCYVYCTKRHRRDDDFNIPINREEMLRDIPINGMKCMSKYGNGKVWAEFICDEIIKDLRGEYADTLCEKGCMTLDELKAYGGNDTLYGWHISELTIYERPRELFEFYGTSRETWPEWDFEIPRPPQSWRYIEEWEEAT